MTASLTLTLTSTLTLTLAATPTLTLTLAPTPTLTLSLSLPLCLRRVRSLWRSLWVPSRISWACVAQRCAAWRPHGDWS